MDTLLSIHSILRWLIVIIGAAALLKFALGWLRQTQFGSMDRGLASGFSGLIDLQALLGIGFFFWSGIGGGIGFPTYRIEHATTMIVAVIVAHLPARWKKSEDKTRFRNTFLTILATAVLIFAGVSSLPGGWTR